MHFKRLGSRGFHNLSNHYLCFFSNIMNTSKQKHKTFRWKFQIFKRCSLDDSHKYEMSMGLLFVIWKKKVAQLWCCHDLHTADGESVLKRTAIADVVYSLQTGITLNPGDYIKGSHSLSNHAFNEIVNTTKVWRRIEKTLQSLHRWRCCTYMCVSK